MNVTEAIRAKRAVRQFSAIPISDKITRIILNAGRRAQSSKNSQPWFFIAIRDKSTMQALSQMGDWAAHLAGAALGVALLTSDPSQRFQTLFDLGQAAAYMQLTATQYGIGSCLASIYQPEKARHILGFPEDLHLHFAISFGYPADPSIISTPLKKGGRHPLEDIVHWEKW